MLPWQAGRGVDLPLNFRTAAKLRDWLPGWRERCGNRGSRTRWWWGARHASRREADREPVAEVAKRHGVSEQTIYTWRKRFGALRTEDVRRLWQLEGENARLKKLVAERDLEIEVMREVAAKNW